MARSTPRDNQPGETAWVILFRGVGGATQLPVKQLKASLTAAGFRHVATYINSGNAVLVSPLSEAEVVARVAAVCARDLGFTKDIHAVSRDGWARLIDDNPFPDAAVAPTTLHAAVLAATPDPARVAALQALGSGQGALIVRHRVAYLHTPSGFSTSELGRRFDKGLGVPNTARNWNTVTRLMQMANDAGRAAAD